MTKCFDLLEVDGTTLGSGLSIGLQEIGGLLGGNWKSPPSPVALQSLGDLPSQGGPLWIGFRLPFRTSGEKGRISLLFDRSKVLKFLRYELDSPKASPVFSPLESLGLLELSNYLLGKLLEHCGSFDLANAEFAPMQAVELGPRSPKVDEGEGIQGWCNKNFGEFEIPLLFSIAMGGREKEENHYLPRSWGKDVDSFFSYSEEGWMRVSSDLQVTCWNSQLQDWTGLDLNEVKEDLTQDWFHWLHRGEVKGSLDRAARLGIPAIFSPFLNPRVFPPGFSCGSSNRWRIEAFPQESLDEQGSRRKDGFIFRFKDYGPLLLAFEDYEIMKEQARAQVEELCLTQGQLEEEKDRAETSDRVKTAFFSNLCHEVRTPLNHLLGELELLWDEELSPQAQESLERLQRAGKGLEQVFQGLMDFSRLAAGKIRFAKNRFPFQRLLGDLLDVFEKKFQEKGLAFRAESLLGDQAELNSDYHRIRQALCCLLDNAYKFTKDGGVQILVLPLEEDGKEAGLRIEVLDTGCGVSSEIQNKIFLPFFQGENHLLRENGGNGIGLSLAKSIVETLGGRLFYGGAGEDGIGSRFVLELPCEEPLISKERGQDRKPDASLAQAAPSPSKEVEIADPSEKKEKPRRRKRSSKPSMKGRILIVDDCMDNQRLFTFFLRKCGIQVMTANNGRIGMEKIQQALLEEKPYDLVLMDIQMPEMDGYEATRRLRADGYKGVIVALTAHAMEGDREKCLAVGCDDYETKPIGSFRLMELVQKNLSAKVMSS